MALLYRWLAGGKMYERYLCPSSQRLVDRPIRKDTAALRLSYPDGKRR
jgi:hypothetical protein